MSFAYSFGRSLLSYLGAMSFGGITRVFYVLALALLLKSLEQTAKGLAAAVVDSFKQPAQMVSQAVVQCAVVQVGKLALSAFGEFFAARYGLPPGVAFTAVNAVTQLSLPVSWSPMSSSKIASPSPVASGWMSHLAGLLSSSSTVAMEKETSIEAAHGWLSWLASFVDVA